MGHKSIARILLCALLPLQIVLSQVSFALDDEGGVDEMVTTDSGKELETKGTTTESLNIGEVITDSDGFEWVVKGVESVDGERYYWVDFYYGKTSADPVASLPDVSGLTSSQNIPDFENDLPTNWPELIGEADGLVKLPEFNSDDFEKELQGSLGEGGFKNWASKVEKFIDNSVKVSEGGNLSQFSNAVPYPELAPIPYRSIEPLRNDYIASIDRQLSKGLEKLSHVHSNVIAYTVAKTLEAERNPSWDCAECSRLNKTLNFAEESRAAEERAGNTYQNSNSSNVPEAQLNPELSNYRFKMPPGTDRTDLEQAYKKLIQATPLHPQGKTAKLIGLNAVAKADRAGARGDVEGFELFKHVASDMAEIAVGFTPIGTAKDAYEAIAGHSVLDGHELTNFERGAAAFGAVVGLMTYGAGSGPAKSALKAGARLVELAKATKLGAAAVRNAVRIATAAGRLGAKTKEGFKKLTEFTARTLGNEVGSIGDVEKLISEAKGSTVKIRDIAVTTGNDASEFASNPLINAKYTERAQKKMANTSNAFHGYPTSIDGFAGFGKKTEIIGGDGIKRLKIELPGSYRGHDGTFEWIIEPDNTVNHRFFQKGR
jgi:hypothetical protein